jgi:broad specificity phosphatase PhoE
MPRVVALLFWLVCILSKLDDFATVVALVPINQAALLPLPYGTIPVHSTAPHSVLRPKSVHFIRHCIAAHNVRPFACSSPEVFDPELTTEGLADAFALGARISSGSPPTDAVILTSSLMRALQTAHELQRTSWTSSLFKPKVIVIEELREVYSRCTADMRRPLSVAASRFPDFDFSGIGSETDPRQAVTSDEQDAEILRRTTKVLALVRSRPEHDVFIISHGRFLDLLMQGAAAAAGLVPAPPSYTLFAPPLPLSPRFVRDASGSTGESRGDSDSRVDTDSDLAFEHCEPRTFVWAA